MAKISKFNESQVEDNFFKIINTWDRLATQENGNRYTRQVSNSKGKRPDSISDVILKSNDIPMQLIAEVKAKHDDKTKASAKTQLKGYMIETLKTGIRPFGVNVFGLSETEIEIACFYLDEEEEIQNIDIKNSNDSVLDYLNYALDVALNKTKTNKTNSIQHIAELEVRGKFAIMHEAIRNHGNIAAADKIILLNACSMALSNDQFRKALRGIKDSDFSRYVYNAIITIIGFHDVEVQEAVKLSIKQFDQAHLPINTPDAVPYKNYMESYAEPGIETMSLPRFICTFVLNEVILPLENKYKDKQIDISSILYNEFLRYTKSDGKDCGVVLTPSHIARLMCYLVIKDPQDVVIDLCTGSAAFLIEAYNRKKSLCKTQADEDKLKEGYIGVELLQHMYFLAFANLVFNNISTDHLIFSDCYKDKVSNNLKNIQPTAGILNPPYAMMKGTKDKKMHEWSFVLESIKYLPKGAKMAAIVPMSCGLNDNKIVNELREEILKNNRLDIIIKVADDLFQPSAAINTSIFVFTVGETTTANHQVFCVDYSKDGFYVSDNKRKPTNKVQDLYDEIIDIIDNKKITDKSNFRKLEAEDWCYLPKDDIGGDLDLELENTIASQISAIL